MARQSFDVSSKSSASRSSSSSRGGAGSPGGQRTPKNNVLLALAVVAILGAGASLYFYFFSGSTPPANANMLDATAEPEVLQNAAAQKQAQEERAKIKPPAGS